MGKVNNYIKKMLKSLKINKHYDKEKPWLKYYEDLPEHLNYYQGSIYDSLRDITLRYPKNSAIRYFGQEITFKSFLKKVDKIASALKEFNIVENECVTICMPNTPESFALIYAVNKIGAICNIVHPLSTTNDILRAINETNSEIIFCSDVSMPQARKINIKHFIMIPTSTSFNNLLKTIYNLKSAANLKLDNHMISWHDFLNQSKNEEFYIKRKANDPAAIIYSGGTTGKPKGIIISNLNFNAMAEQTRSVCDEIRPGNSVLAALPIFHVFGLALCTHACLSSGVTCIVIPKINTKQINKELKKHKPNIYPAVPSLLKMTITGTDPGKNAFKDIKVVVVGGDYLSPEVKNKMEEYLRIHGSNAKIITGYGLSEATGFSCCTSYLTEKDYIPGTLGIPNPDTIIKVFEPNTDIEKPTNEIGEICINGPTIMMGYINEDQETKKTLLHHHDNRTWLHTGDLGYIDKNGLLFYTSRIKRMIISNGYNIYPIELEEIINKCEYVETCTVVAIPHKIKNQTPKAVIVLKNNIEDTTEIRNAIKRYCYREIAKYAVPTEFEFRNSIPKTAIGKVAYRDLEK